jgi:hypothetical protein
MDYLLQLNYYNYLMYNDYINLIMTKKEFYKNIQINNDFIYRYYLYKKYTEEFIKMTFIDIISYKDSFINIIVFENVLNKYGYELSFIDKFSIYRKKNTLLELTNLYK